MFELNRIYDLGKKKFSEEEIIDFALRYDPLEFHISAEAAKRSLFKALVCSGPHPFHHFYKNQWIPEFGKSVVAGIAVDNWKFLKPVYADQNVHGTIQITELIPHPGKGTVTVRWLFEFRNDQGELFQQLEMTVLHNN